MRISVVMMPVELPPRAIEAKTVVAIDVLRATTTITAALAAGVKEVRVHPNIPSAVAAARAFGPSALLCGEERCLRPEGFHLGNSPGDLNARQHSARTLFMSTTNGTRAIAAADAAAEVLVGALVNRSAVARYLVAANRDAVLLCAGTDGEPSMEDLIGAGAILEAACAIGSVEARGDLSRVARCLFVGSASNLPAALRQTDGGRNVLAAGLGADIEFCADIDRFGLVGLIRRGPLRVEAADVDTPVDPASTG